MPGVLRLPCKSPFGPPSCTASALAGECTNAGSWQLAHDCRPDADSVVSAKIFSPSTAWSESARSAGGAAALAAVPPPPQPASAIVAPARHAPIVRRNPLFLLD